MKKFVYLLLFGILFSVSICNAQSFSDRLHSEISFSKGKKDKGITPLGLTLELGADITSRLYVLLGYETNYTLIKKDGERSYLKGNNLGGGLGVNLFTFNKKRDVVDLRLRSSVALFKPEWKSNTYQVGIAWYFKNHRFSPIMEIGYKFIDSRTTGLRNYGNFYISYGIRFL